ncbi:MAG: HDOD domain-containing protein [Planctomycetes bacterium]|nr:HDOD domain-containing protein [Planctomycetota bacterium]
MNADRLQDTAATLERIAARSTTLYSRPTVALEILKLAEQPQMDARALQKCLEQDPALSCKILRVVNSSLFGLRVQVGALDQAVALLGIKPLKLLVLGFSLPDGLFAEVAAKQLQWYWTNALTRAVAARLLSEHLWRQPGDEAFTAAMLQDIGILVLVRELGKPYTSFLAGVIEERCHLATLERETLGFDHLQLSAMLLARWRLPARLVTAVATPKQTSLLAQAASPDADLPQILHLADLLVELVGQRRLHILPDLLEAGEAFHALTKAKLHELVEQLQPQVDQLAQALSLELADGRDYVQVLTDAHEQMAMLSEECAGAFHSQPSAGRSDAMLLEQAQKLTVAMRRFLSGTGAAEARAASTQRSAIRKSTGGNRTPPVLQVAEVKSTTTLQGKLAVAANRCRDRRHELSLLLVEPNVYDFHSDPTGAEVGERVRRSLRLAMDLLENSDVELVAIGERRTAAILSNCERRVAVSMAHHTIASAKAMEDRMAATAAESATTLSAGVATVAGIAKNFAAEHLIECAERCLAAARTCGISTVKSIEV